MLKQFNMLILAVTLLAAGCGGSSSQKIDASSEEAMKKSVQEITKKMSADEKKIRRCDDGNRSQTYLRKHVQRRRRSGKGSPEGCGWQDCRRNNRRGRKNPGGHEKVKSIGRKRADADIRLLVNGALLSSIATSTGRLDQGNGATSLTENFFTSTATASVRK